ncbi:MAG TPA: hypothetical protein DDW17_07410 [Deltaproteobacteria bacterium]|nr:hypothetical protein [Deltaproteobacteria bacterium]
MTESIIKQKVKYFQEPLFEEFRKDYCYVCYRRIKDNKGLYIGNSLWRHKKCKPYRIKIG